MESPTAKERLASAAAKCNRFKKSSCYKREYRRYCAWVEANDLRAVDATDTYVNRLAVDSYFRTVVVHRNGQLNSINKICSAIQWACNCVENPTVDTAMTVRNPAVSAAIRRQQLNWKEGANDRNCGTDPHKGLKDLMPIGDKLTLIRHIHDTRADWGSLATSYTWGTQGGVRGDSNRKMVYADMNLSMGFGPETTGPRARTVLLVLRKGEIHKDCYSTDKQVGTWRNKHYILCATFNLALHVICQLGRDLEIDFLHEEKTDRAPWWDKPLIDYDDGSEEGAAMRQVLDATGVESCKLTHHRTQCVQLAGAESLAPWQINTLTKHLLEKLNSAYQSECDAETLKVMANFRKSEAYFNALSHLQLPHDIDYYIKCLLPRYDDWMAQRASPTGDKSKACTTFLTRVIPYLVEVLVQNGIYFIEEFPDHEMSIYLKVSPKCSTFIRCLVR